MIALINHFIHVYPILTNASHYQSSGEHRVDTNKLYSVKQMAKAELATDEENDVVVRPARLALKRNKV